MKLGKYVWCFVGLLTLVAGIRIGTAISQQSPPTENKGLEVKLLGTIDLAPEMPAHQLRLRSVVVEPGGVIGLHGHSDRPAFVYVLEGTLTELKEGGYTQAYKSGETLTESRDVTHWAENRGTSRVVFVVTDLMKKP
jgi:quercetin dioxygenase-like cupin family protein